MTSMVMMAALAAVTDFGPEGVGGYPEIDVEGVAAPARIRVVYATHPDGLGEKGDFWHETRATYMGPDVWLPILPASTDRYDVFTVVSNGTYRAPLAQGLVRYAKWTLEAGSASVKAIRFVNDGIHAEEPVVGSFECSDPKLAGVWRASVRTCQLAAIPARTKTIVVRGRRAGAELGPSYAYLSDGAKRDRLVWSGDLWWAQRNVYFGFAADVPYMSGSIRMLGESQMPCGYVQACPYPESHGPVRDGDWGPFASDEFAAWYIPVLRDHFLYSGDQALARAEYPRVPKLLDYLSRHQRDDMIFMPRKETCKGAAGLVFGARSLLHHAYMNILVWKAYRDAASLADRFDTKSAANEWRSMSDVLAASIRKSFWNGEKGWFDASEEERGEYAREANGFALACGFATPEEAARIVPNLRRNGHGKFQAMNARGAFEYGYADKALALIADHNWYKLLDPGWKGVRTTSECMHMTRKGWGDEAHPDTAIAGLFSNYILGVEPVEPGFAAFRVKPRIAHGITWAKGRVPTPHGFINVSWKLENGKPVIMVSAPAACRRVDE